MHNDVLLIIGAILQTYEPYRKRRSIKMGQREPMYGGMKINHKLHFNKLVRVAAIYSFIQFG